MEECLDVVVHEIGHDEEVDYLRYHEPVSHILRQQAHRPVSVQLGVGEDPERDEEHPGYGLSGYEVGGVGLDVAFLSRGRGTLLRKSTNWLRMAKV